MTAPTIDYEARFGMTHEALKAMSRSEREELARGTNKQVFYLRDESQDCIRAANEAVLRAAPQGHRLEELNGINVGAGDRHVSDFVTTIDLKRVHKTNAATGSFLAPMKPLPFRPGVLDYIVSLHSLEHVSNPIEVLLHWIESLKPGGGIGLILPDWRYTWDARIDGTAWGHKWNPDPDLIAAAYDRYLKPHCELEALDTFDYKISFDVILRKPGEFVPFRSEEYLTGDSGKSLASTGQMFSDTSTWD